MIIALDYDRTYTEAPDTWLGIVELLRGAGHEVFCCTMRYPNEVSSMDSRLLDLVQVVPTSRRAKKDFMQELGVTVSVWIDDNPAFILCNSGDYVASERVHTASVSALQNAPKTKAKMTIKKPQEAPNA